MPISIKKIYHSNSRFWIQKLYYVRKRNFWLEYLTSSRPEFEWFSKNQIFVKNDHSQFLICRRKLKKRNKGQVSNKGSSIFYQKKFARKISISIKIEILIQKCQFWLKYSIFSLNSILMVDFWSKIDCIDQIIEFYSSSRFEKYRFLSKFHFWNCAFLVSKWPYFYKI